MSWQVGLYVAAVLIPLAAFAVQILAGRALGRFGAYVATGAIAASFALSLVGFIAYFSAAEGAFAGHHEAAGEAEVGEADEGDPHGQAVSHHAEAPLAWTAEFDWVALGGESIRPRGGVGGARAPIDLAIPVGVRIDNLAAIMFLMVTFIATLIHLYSIGYMAGDPRYGRFFAYLSLFCFSMLGLVASASIFMVFVFWELVGVCSYLLIGFWYEDKANSDAANKAFITNRVGDIGMLLGLGLLWATLGTFDIQEINTSIRDASGYLNVATGLDGSEYVQLRDRETGSVLVDPATDRPRQIALWALGLAGLGIFAGCVGKSAQFPLHVWLPDAMAGPTPVSALIHAATMVAAGVYLVGRFFPVFTDGVLLTIAYTGGITLFIAATIAMVQSDYKKVLAYSTVSQLGFMMLGLGVGGWSAGLFHLLTHAFFKALLFLGAGSVYHSVHTYDMPSLGGLLRKMPITGYTMLAATLAISGVPFFSGFYSKDAILASSIHFVFTENNQQHILLFVLPTIGAMVTAFYMFRMWFLVFTGPPRPLAAGSHGHGHGHGHGGKHDHPVHHAHESEPIMSWPLVALAVPTVAIGWPLTLGSLGILPTAEPLLERMLAYGAPVRAADLGDAHLWAMGASILIATVGIGLGFLYYSPFRQVRRLDPARTSARFNPVTNFLVHKWYFDELYRAVLVRPTLALGRGVAWLDRRVIDGVVNGSAGLTVLASWFSGLFDRRAVDGVVDLVAQLTYALGEAGRRLQTGRLRHYLMFLAGSMVAIFAVALAWVGR